MLLLQRYIVPLWKTTPLPRMISKARRFPLLSSHLLYSLVSFSFSLSFQSFRITQTKEGEFPLSLSSSQLFNLASGKKIPWLKVNIGVISRMFRYTVGGYYFLYFSPSAIHSTVRETTPGVLWGHTRDWSLRYAISKPPGKGSRSREQAINRISRDCRPLLHILANNIANDAIGTEGRGRWKRGKNFSSPLFDRPPTCHFFFVSFFFSLFSFAFFVSRTRRGGANVPRGTANNGIRPLRIELINRISREDIDCLSRPITKGIPLRICFLCFLPFISRFLSFRPFELTTDSNSRGILVVVIDAPLKIF